MSEKRRDNRNRILREGEYQRKGGRYTESKKENWRHEKLSTKIQTKPLKKPLQQRLYFRA